MIKGSKGSRGFVLVVVLLLASPAAAQSFEASAQFVSSQWSEFDGTDRGIGGRFTWKPMPLVGVDAELAWYPGDFPPDGIPFTQDHVEGLFGVTVGPRLERVRPFGKFAAGFLHTSSTQEFIACIAIFPPPLTCLMAASRTLPAMDFGGGVELSVTDRTFVRVDATARMLKYPGPSIQFGDTDRTVRDDDFWGTGFRFTAGGGFRF
jgi:hypothetical protein